MSMDTIRSSLPDYAKDLKLNLSSLANEDILTAQQFNGTLLAAAITTRNAKLIKAAHAEVADKLSPEAIKAAKGAAAIMGMNNIYYRFVHLTSASDYQTMPAKLRMTFIGKPGVEKLDFELWSLAVSAINGCGMCMDSHEKIAREAGLSPAAIQAAIRLASVISALAITLDGEDALAE